MTEVTKYKALGEMVQRSRVGGADFVALASYDELERRLAESLAAHEVAAQNHGALNTEVFVLQRRADLLEGLLRKSRENLYLHAMEYSHPGQHDLIAQIDAQLNPADGKAAPYDRRSDLGCYFGLSYASWLTLPRVLMEAMPDAWKKGIARLLHEYSETYTNQPDYGTSVRITVGGKLAPMPDWLNNYRHPNAEMIDEMRGRKSAEGGSNE